MPPHDNYVPLDIDSLLDPGQGGPQSKKSPQKTVPNRKSKKSKAKSSQSKKKGAKIAIGTIKSVTTSSELGKFTFEITYDPAPAGSPHKDGPTAQWHRSIIRQIQQTLGQIE